MTLHYGSICSGIEAATVAWHPLGWQPAFFSEIDQFPRAVLKFHYPDVPLHGDFTTIKAGEYDAIDLLVGGTPCQSFSIAGLRGGMADERGNLALEYLRLAQRLRPRWLVWENVPGVLSSGGGRDFGSILGGLGELGYGFAYRVLDAQFVRVDGFSRAVPQRRRRVFVVGYLGDWRRAAAVLFERESLQGHPPPRREAREDVALALDASSARRRGSGMNPNQIVAAEHAATLTRGADSAGKGGYAGRRREDDINLVAHTLNAKGGVGRLDYESETLVAHSLRGGGFDASEDGTGRGTPLVPVPAIAFNARQDPDVFDGHTGPLDTDGSTQGILSSWRVRRLMPVECERLQGFPDRYTDVPYRRRNSTPDGPRYKALGNSMAVNVMRWIGRRIEGVEAA